MEQKELSFIVAMNTKWYSSLKDTLEVSYKAEQSYHVIQQLHS